MTDVVVECRGLTRVYQEEAVPVHALRGVDFTVERGEFVVIAGAFDGEMAMPATPFAIRSCTSGRAGWCPRATWGLSRTPCSP